MLGLLLDINVERPWAERHSREVLNLGSLCRGEESRLPRLGKNLNNSAHLVLETSIENPVRLVDNKHAQVLEHESLGVLKVIQQSPWCSDQEVYSRR